MQADPKSRTTEKSPLNGLKASTVTPHAVREWMGGNDGTGGGIGGGGMFLQQPVQSQPSFASWIQENDLDAVSQVLKPHGAEHALSAVVVRDKAKQSTSARWGPVGLAERVERRMLGPPFIDWAFTAPASHGLDFGDWGRTMAPRCSEPAGTHEGSHPQADGGSEGNGARYSYLTGVGSG